MSEVVKVTALGQTYKHQGKGFGPFQGTPDRPFLEVPLAVALASGAPVYTGEETQAAEGDDLAAQVASLTTERDDLRAKLEEADSQISFLKLDVQNLTARIQDAISKIPDDVEVAGPAPIQAASPLPDDFPMRALLIEHGFDSLEKVRAGLVKPDGAEKSPVENINGIGKKTLEAIEAALK